VSRRHPLHASGEAYQARNSPTAARTHRKWASHAYDDRVAIPVSPYLLLAAGASIVGGLGALVRGFGGYRTANRIGDTSSSRIASIAAGEVRLSGIVEAAEVTLVSPLQSAPCVYYRASIHQSEQRTDREVFNEERAVGFRLRDDTGTIRVFPRDGRWEVPDTLHASTGVLGDEPAGLQYRLGPPIVAGPLEREAQIAELLTVHDRRSVGGGLGMIASDGYGLSMAPSHRSYAEARIEPGQIVTVVGAALPYADVEDPALANVGGAASSPFGLDDPEVAADLEEARAAGLTLDPAIAWGNAAIPGFGIGHPTSAPVLDPQATPPPIASPEEATRARQLFDIAPEELVVAAQADLPLLIALGTPGEAANRELRQFLLGLLGAVVAIVGAVVLALLLSGSFTVTGL
jgi:hypothetical protein